MPPFACPNYCAAKAGVVNYMRSAAPALLEKGIRINAVCPAVIHTALVRPCLWGLCNQAMPDLRRA